MYSATANAAQINAGSLPGIAAPNGLAQLNNYMSPYTQNVVNATLAELNRQNRIALNNTNQNATSENAFGGTRQAVADALTNDDYARAAANTAANLNSQGFNTASGLLQNNQQMGLQAGQANLNAALNAANTNAANQQQAGLVTTLGNAISAQIQIRESHARRKISFAHCLPQPLSSFLIITNSTVVTVIQIFLCRG